MNEPIDNDTLAQMKHMFQNGHSINSIAKTYDISYAKVKWAFDSRGWKSTHKQFHGMTDTRLYRIHSAMKTRCTNPKFTAYKYYGGKGIGICEEWNDFLSFQQWALENGYEDHLTIDRVDSDGNYEPNNCRWITLEDQQRNKDNNVFHNVNGEMLSVREISIKYGIKEHTVWSRLSEGKTGSDLTKPVKVAAQHIIKGESITLEDASYKYSIPWSTLRSRYRRGIRGDNLLLKNNKGYFKGEKQCYHR